MARKKTIVGLDFDGVVAYNPFRTVRAPVTYVKRRFLGVTKTRFFIPKTPLQKVLWTIVHESSMFPGKGAGLLRQLSRDPQYEFHLITARFDFLQPTLYAWLSRWRMEGVFTSITMNMKNEQPHVYKQKTLAKLKPDYYVEDNLDIVRHLDGKTDAKVLWIYNITDRAYPYPEKYPYIEKALKRIMS